MEWNLLALGCLLPLALLGCSSLATSDNPAPIPVTITVNVDKPGARINPAMWGAFFEDINFGADGGLYAELVKNRGFEFPDPLMGWVKLTNNVSPGDVSVRTDNPYRPSSPHYVRISSKAEVFTGILNEGFRGMGFVGGDLYDFSAQIRLVDGNPRITVELVAGDGTLLATKPLGHYTDTWRKISTTLKPNATDAKGHLNIIVEGTGTVDLDYVSLFPQKTWKNRPGGLRADMVQMLADLKPGFLRFPGGCIVEGPTLPLRYQWKNTIGPVEDRQILINRWNTEFKHRPTPDYYQSFGLGFFEYFQLAEDIGAEPLPLVNCGMACEFNSNELCPLPELGPYVQDALDLIEFANGPVTSIWGKKRADMGHPAPFNLKMIGIGNEQWGSQYIERLAVFTREIKAKYPDIKLVSAAGPSPEDERFQYLWPELRKLNADIVDEHCYANPIWFLANANRYDTYDRNGPKVFFGEYAAQSVAICSPKNKNNLECALAEAACMTGLERNAQVVRMASYAPLFSNIDAWQWTPDLMWTNSLVTLATPNYYVQQLFTTNRGDVILPVTNNAPIQDLYPTGRVGVGTIKASAEFKDMRVEMISAAGVPYVGLNLAPNSSFSSNPDWTGGETWNPKGDGVYQQSDPKAAVNSFNGSAQWRNYTLTLKARKLAGEGSLAITVLDDGAGARAQWQLGGWGNTQHGILTHYAEQDQLLERVPGKLVDNQWYDIKIVVTGAKMDCYLDGKLIQSAEVLHHRVPALFTSATRDEKNGETILKVVNPGNAPGDATIKLQGAGRVDAQGTVTTLTGNLTDENSFDKPTTVVPVTEKFFGAASEFRYTFQPRSMTVLRLGTPK